MSKQLGVGVFCMAFALAIALFLLPGCVNPQEDDKPDNTEIVSTQAIGTNAPNGTGDPVSSTQEAPTEAAYHAHGVMLTVDSPIQADIDFDGIMDTVSVTIARQNQFDTDYMLTIALKGDMSNAYSYSFEHSYGMIYGIIADFITDDGRLDILVNFMKDGGDNPLYAYRVNDEGNGIDSFHKFCSVSTMHGEAYMNGVITCEESTEILGSNYLLSMYTVTDEGFVPTADAFEYLFPYPISVIDDFEATVIDEETGRLCQIIVSAGSVITPVETDCSTYALVSLPSGENAYIYITLGDYNAVLINGLQQDYLLDIQYAG